MTFQHLPASKRTEGTKNNTSNRDRESRDQPLWKAGSSRFHRDFSQIPVHAAPIQAKLTIGQIGDRCEQEADRIADQVVEQSDSPGEFGVKRVSGMIQRQAIGGAATNLDRSIEQARGNGQPLHDQTRESMERSFGTDFSQVRVHTDAESDQLNQAIQAKAFTTARDIFFRQGAYDPQSRSGQKLIAHELTHVVQQNGRSQMIQRTSVTKASVTNAIATERTAYATSQEQAFFDSQKSNVDPILKSKDAFLLMCCRNSRDKLRQEYTDAGNTIVPTDEYFQGRNLSSWGQIEDYKFEYWLEQFVEMDNYKDKVETAQEAFKDELKALNNLLEKMKPLYDSLQSQIETESLGESLSTRLESKLNALKGKEKPTAIESSLQTQLTSVMGEINELKKVRIDAKTIIESIQGDLKAKLLAKQKAFTEIITTEEQAKATLQTLIDRKPETNQFRANQKKIQQNAQLFLAFFDEGKDDATLSESTSQLPIDQPEIHQYYLNRPKQIKEPVLETIWSAKHQNIVLSLWSHYKEVWLDALHFLPGKTLNTVLPKLVNPESFEVNYLLTEVPPGSANYLKLAGALGELNQARDKTDFFSRYEIEKIGSNMHYREVLSPQFNNVLTKKGTAVNDRIGYVVNITTIPSDPSPEQIAAKYYAEGFDDQAQARERVAIVVGVNKFRSLNNTSDKQVAEHAAKLNFDKFNLVSFGFTWDFNWISKTSGDPHGFEGAFKAFKQQDDATQKAALAYQSQQIGIQNRLPYAQFKERVTAHSKTREMVELLGTYNKYVYIHLGDSDAVSLKAPEEQPTSSMGQVLMGNLAKSGNQPKGIFSRYDAAMATEKPFMAIGGYEFRTKGTSGSDSERESKGDLKRDKLEHLLTYLANQLDIAVRIAVAKVQPRAIYPTEPNLVFMAMSPDYSLYSEAMGLFEKDGKLKQEGGLFGEGAREGRKLQNKLLAARQNAKITGSKTVYDPRLGIATGSDRFRLKGKARADYKPEFHHITGAANPTYQERRKNKIRGEKSHARKDAFKSQIIEDIANQPQTFVVRSLKLEITEVLSERLMSKAGKEWLGRFTNRISNELAQKYIKVNTFKALTVERAAVDEKNENTLLIEAVIGSVEKLLADARLKPLWTAINAAIDDLYRTGYQTD